MGLDRRQSTAGWRRDTDLQSAAVAPQDPGQTVLLEPGSMLFPHRPARGPAVEIDASPVYELLLNLLIFRYARNGACLHAGEWLTAKRDAASAEILQALDELSPGYWLWHSLLFLAWELRAGRKALHAAQFIEQIRSMDAQYLYEYVVGGGGRSDSIPSVLVHQAVVGDRRARLRLGKALFLEDQTEGFALDRFLGIPPDHVKELLIRIISGWHVELFREEERKLATSLANEARTKRIIGNSAPGRLLRAAAIGVHYLPRRSVSRVVLVPTIVCRPSMITIRFGATRMFFYPIADEPADEDTLAQQLVKIHKALADLERLRILRSLIATDGTPESLGRELGRPPEAIRSQLIILRDAGLVTLRMNERRMSFVTRQNLPSVVYRTLHAFLPDRSGRGRS